MYYQDLDHFHFLDLFMFYAIEIGKWNWTGRAIKLLKLL